MRLSAITPVQSTEIEMAMLNRTRKKKTKKKRFEYNETLVRNAFRPMILSMKCLGLYFAKTNNEAKDSYWRTYCIVIGTLLWLNVLRLFTMFTPRDSFQDILTKCGYVAWMTMAAVINTSCYRLSSSGRVEELLDKIGNDMHRRFKQIRLSALVGAGGVWAFTILNTASIGYYLFGGVRLLETAICSLNTFILTAEKSVKDVAGCLFLVINFYVAGSAVCPLMWIVLWASVFRDQFDACRKLIVYSENQNSENIEFEALRRHHQALCRMVDRLDRYVCLTNGSYFVGNIAIVILNLYSLVSFPVSGGAEAIIVMWSQFVWLLAIVILLFILSYGGIVINNAVS